MVARSSGAPAPRPPGAPIGSPAPSADIGGDDIGDDDMGDDDMGDGPPGALTEPNVCGAPGAFGFCVGSNASPRRPGALVVAGPAGCGGGFCGRDCNAGRGAPFAFDSWKR